jgi:hypothetical protein
MVTNILISTEYATGYATGNWDDRMHILINFSSGGTAFGQAWSKTAFGFTLLRMSSRTQIAILLFCIVTMNSVMIIKVFFQWAKYCGQDDYQQWYRLQGVCINNDFEQSYKVFGNSKYCYLRLYNHSLIADSDPSVYNIAMDFVFAAFPWWITWNLTMRRIERIALCSTMSLGML